ncbi:hypothetical protein J5U46_08280 [Micromonospora tulbaghiae]|uniref:Hemerythrin HHE cation binding domain-containing protein n=1 Tax=Micromonospora tulbaghiae TaxID=479978 RepID=A0AAW4JE52_9ACTN|nr:MULTISPECIES: hypothetical protein [Micromonospora]KAB1905604.1 hypothetical protein F8279_17235 [Micromonospora sp. AMSO1212t]MBO4140137.1 hypothetical protein [Micromonospora tulbaghiae]MDX5460628.1 hypothetical protein [Micromonospora tulbaghiae]SCE80586.1 hypothetical protein GA0070562_2868 [Micromonospora tulbaghiae]
MVTSPIQQPTAVLPSAAGDLRALGRAPATGPRWRERLLTDLNPVRRGFTEHVRVTEGAGGHYADLVRAAPRLDRGVRLLVGEHAAISAALAALQHAVRLPGVSAAEVRARTRDLLRALDRHRRHGADLLWEAYQADLGGED